MSAPTLRSAATWTPLPWIERRFSFDFPVEIHADMVERVRGTPARIRAKTDGLTPGELTKSIDGGWSIQENVGHLADIESLGLTRLGEYLAGAGTLSAANMANPATHEANHNARPFAEVFAKLHEARATFVRKLDALPTPDFARTAIHPRLKMPMRLVDFVAFIAAHDDYHLSRMSYILQALGKADR